MSYDGHISDQFKDSYITYEKRKVVPKRNQRSSMKTVFLKYLIQAKINKGKILKHGSSTSRKCNLSL